tara:strand:+ start:1551 stop:2231 length:681 start_codon:yes stop_codon:yes gene_type:complete
MKTLDNDLIRDIFKINKDIPIYHTDDELLLKLLDKSDNNNISTLTDEPIHDRPFDFMATSIFCKTGDDRDYYFLTYFEKGEIVTNKCVMAKDLKLITNFDSNRDMTDWFDKMTLMTVSLFGYKQTKIYLTECATRRVTSKGKSKQVKQKIRYISIDKIIKKNSNISSGVKRSFLAHLVSGHWRHYKADPKTKGHDRNNKSIIGKTWIPSYPRGEGAEIMETIRQWR